MAARREHVLAALDVQAIVLAWLLVAVASSGALGCALSAVMVPLLCASITCRNGERLRTHNTQSVCASGTLDCAVRLDDLRRQDEGVGVGMWVGRWGESRV